MLDSIKELFATAPFLAWSIVSVLVGGVVIAAMWEKVRWWWLNTWMSFPVIGKIARLSKDTNRDSGNANWFKSERTLCSEYNQFVPAMSEHDYHEAVDYLVLAGDNGRTHMPGWLWPIIILMVFVEALGFSYVIAGFTIPGASEHTQQMGAYGIAFLVSAVLIFFTHFAGHELYRNNRINESRYEWQQAGRKFELKSGTVPLSRPQNTDKDFPEYTRRINRIGTSLASYNISIITATLVVLVAIGATYVRGQVLEKMVTQEIMGQTTAIEAKSSAPSDGLDMSEVKLPAADQASDNAAQTKGVKDTASNDIKGGWMTFIVLAIIFVALQLLGIYFGFRWGFAGQNSNMAFRAIGSGKFGSYNQVRDHYNYIATVAQSKLEELQQRMMERIATGGTSDIRVGSNNFRKFLQEDRDEKAKDHEHQRGKERAEEAKPATKAEPAPAPATAVVAQDPVVAEDVPLTLEAAMSHLKGLTSKEDKKTYIGTLPASLQAEVMAALKAAKEEEQAKAAKLDAELDGLL